MSYSVKEIYYTLQGEGAQTGARPCSCASPAAICGPARARPGKAVCQFCDTDFVGTDGPGGGKFKDAEALAHAVEAKWPKQARGKRYVVCTGGEPLLQIDKPLIDALHRLGFEIGVETNGTQEPPPGLDWICVSPKRMPNWS